MIEVTPTQQLKETTHGVEIPRRANDAKGVTYQDARVYAQRWRDRTDDIAAYLDGVDVPHLDMFIDAGLGKPICFRNIDDNEQGRFPDSPTSPWSLRNHPKYANQGEDYDGSFDAMTSDSPTVAQTIIDGAQRVQINRARKLQDVSLLPPQELIKHPRNSSLAREVGRELKTSEAPTGHAH